MSTTDTTPIAECFYMKDPRVLEHACQEANPIILGKRPHKDANLVSLPWHLTNVVFVLTAIFSDK